MCKWRQAARSFRVGIITPGRIPGYEKEPPPNAEDERRRCHVKPRVVSSPVWETLEPFVRTQIQGFIQQLLEDEVAELLGRAKSERRAALDAPTGSRNGHGKPRQLALLSGTITVRRPRVA